MIKIIVDSTTDLPQAILKDHDIDMIPLQIDIEDKTYADKVDISIEEVHEKLLEDYKFNTSLPLYSEIYDTFVKHAQKGEDFIYIAFSSKLSGTYNFACSVLEDVQSEYPNVKMAVIDSKSGGLATGLIVLKTLEKLKNSDDFNEIEAYIIFLTKHICHFFMVNDLKQLGRQGRINKNVAIIGNVFHIRPILHVEEGEIKLLNQSRGTNNAVKKLVDLVMKKIKDFEFIGINYSNNFKLAEDVIKIFKNKYQIDKFILEPIGSVLTTNIGLDAVGIYFFDEQV